jgi:hypothetical protein
MAHVDELSDRPARLVYSRRTGVAQAWMDTTLERVRRYHGEATSLPHLDHATMLIIILGALLAWLIGEMLDL